MAINVSPAEAARRREAATNMLTSAGVDPSSLSVEQFNIFANQSPELQKESLMMLVKYGAERLRIVHPGNTDAQNSAATSTSSTPAQVSQSSPSGPTTTDELVPQTQLPEDDAAMTTTETLVPSQATPKTNRRIGKSRVACLQCKQFKVKVRWRRLVLLGLC
jgi:ATP-dependent DNA helicase 2 subunit 1